MALKTDTAPRVLGIIPARGGSKGIPRKNLRPLAGKPLIEYTCQAALASRTLTRTLVSTDCPWIAGVARNAGVDVPFLRPAQLASDIAAGVDVVRHTLDWFARRQQPCPDVVVLLQPTAPLRRADHIDDAVALLHASGSDSVVSVTPLPSRYHPQWQFVIRDRQLRSLTGTALAQLAPRRQDLPVTYTRNGALYVFRPRVLETTGSLYGNRCLAYVMPPEVSVNIDTLEDWQRAETLLASDWAEAHDAA